MIFFPNLIRACWVADEMNDKIYMLGGYYQDYEAWVYTISSNSWAEMYDSSLKYGSHVSENKN